MLPNGTVDFNIQFDLQATKKVVVTDISSYPVSVSTLGVLFEITSPDGLTDRKEFSAGTYTQAPFEVNLRPDASGAVMKGTYVFTLTVTEGGVPQAKQYTLNFQYDKVDVDIQEAFDEFVPELKMVDGTDYTVAGYSETVIRTFTGTNQFINSTVSTSGDELLLQYGGNFYDSNHLIALSAIVVYLNDTEAWFSVKDLVTYSGVHKPVVPPPMPVLVDYITEYKELLDSYKNRNLTLFQQTKIEYSHVLDLLYHANLRYNKGDITNAINYLRDVLLILKNQDFITGTPTNAIILPFVFDGSSSSVTWLTLPGKPSVFPPAPHNHTWTEITGKPTTFTPSSHTHPINQISDFQLGILADGDRFEYSASNSKWVNVKDRGIVSFVLKDVSALSAANNLITNLSSTRGKFIPKEVRIFVKSLNNVVTTQPVISIGYNGPNYNNVLLTYAIQAFDGSHVDRIEFIPIGGGIQLCPAGSGLYLQVASPATGPTSYTFDIELTGSYLY